MPFDVTTTIERDEDVSDELAAAAQIVSAVRLYVDAARRLGVPREQAIERASGAIAESWPEDET